MWESIPKHWLNLWVPQWGLPGRPTDMGNTHNCHMGTLHSCPSVIRSIPLLMIPRLNWFTVWRAKKMAYPYPNPWRIKSRVSYAVLSCFVAFFQTRLFFMFRIFFYIEGSGVKALGGHPGGLFTSTQGVLEQRPTWVPVSGGLPAFLGADQPRIITRHRPIFSWSFLLF